LPSRGHSAMDSSSVDDSSSEASPTAKPSTSKACGAWVFPLAVAVVANLFYMTMSWFPNHKYLEWAESRPQCQEALPDLLLDLHDFGEQATIVTQIADALPGLMLFSTAIACAVTKNLLIWNRFLMTQSFVIVLNFVAEQSTMLPSSYGFKRCKAYLGINSAAEDRYQFSATGSCVAMIWSGHVFHMMIGGYMIGLVLEERFPGLKRRTFWGSRSAPLLKSVVVVVLACIEMSILVIDKGHYTVDMFLAMIISMLTFTNDNVEYWLFHVNPFIRSVVPARDQPMKHGQLRAIIKELQCGGGGRLRGEASPGVQLSELGRSDSASS